MANKLLITLTCGRNDPEKATVAFNVATTAIMSDMEVLLAMSSEGSTLSVKNGAADEIAVPGMPSLKELMATFVENGGQMIVCTPCFMKRGYKEEDLREGVTLAGAAKVVEFISQGAATLSF